MRVLVAFSLSATLITIPALAAEGDAVAIPGLTAFIGGAWLLLLAAAVVVYARGRKARESARMAEKLLATAPAAYLILGPGKLVTCSPKLSRWLGLAGPVTRLEDLASTDHTTGIGNSDFQVLADAVSRLLADGQGFKIDLRSITRDVALEAEGSPEDSGPRGRGVVWLTNVSERTHREHKQLKQISLIAKASDYLARILDAAPFPIWRRRKSMKLEWVNKAYVEAVDGVSKDAVIEGQIELLSTSVAPPPETIARKALAGKAAHTEKHFVVISGKRCAIQVTDVPLVAENAVVGFAIDRTELEDARSELARHIEAHSETLNKLSAAVAIFGPDKYLEFFNDTFAKLWRLPEDWLATKPGHGEIIESMQAKRRLPEQADFPAWKRARLALYSKLISPSEELWHLPDASTLRVVTQPHPFGGLLVLYEDVTDRLALEASYNTLTAVQRETLNNLYEGIAVFGSDGILRLHNPAFEKIWRIDGGFLEGSPHISEVLEYGSEKFEADTEWRKVIAAILGHADKRNSKTGRMHRPDGTVIDYASVPLPDGATLYTFLDATDSFRIERALRERNEALETADRLKSEFIAHVSYELRTPLNTILGFTEILDKEYYGPLNDRQHEYVEGTLDSTNQLLTLINDILDLATIEAGAMTLEPAEFDLYAALKTVLAIAGEQAEKKGISIEFDCAPDIGMIEADVRRIKQILFNLLSNAIKFTAAEGVIKFGARMAGDQFECYVSDTGIGMDANEQVEAFEKFWTAGIARKGQGAGLGLSLVRSFVELHGGHIELSSKPGEGTLVRCIFPSVLSPAAAEAQRAAAAEGDGAIPNPAVN